VAGNLSEGGTAVDGGVVVTCEEEAEEDKLKEYCAAATKRKKEKKGGENYEGVVVMRDVMMMVVGAYLDLDAARDHSCRRGHCQSSQSRSEENHHPGARATIGDGTF